jgi:hypothetical protein
MPLQITSSKVVYPFKFCLNSNIQQGMTFQGKLYQLLREFEPQQKGKAYVLGCQLSARGMHVVLSSDGTNCALWVDLRPEHGIQVARAIASYISQGSHTQANPDQAIQFPAQKYREAIHHQAATLAYDC